ncbi:MAG: S8 family serine peptidase [Bacteroidetes bacterium]|nr:S8 family serine peptidase [Bacteroidota bacterium]
MAKSKKSENEFTGRYLVLLPEGTKSEDFLNQVKEISDFKLKKSTDFENEFFTSEELDKTDGIVLDKLGIAILNDKPKMDMMISSLTDNESRMIVEPERVVHAIHQLDEGTEKYIEGYRDAINNLADTLLGSNEVDFESEDESIGISAVGATWGLKATNVVPQTLLRYNPYSGNGIKLAVLDTGFDFNHPDFAGRIIQQQSFISGQATQDGHGHGTHCIGTACGPVNPAGNIERYGIAYNTQIYAGKVLSNSGSGADGGILAGINWAIANGCTVISMSLGAKTTNAGFSAVYENAAVRALNAGCLIIAAAGNDSNRPGYINAVSHPANCPSIMAVGAVDINMNIAYFSNGGLFPTYGAVDIAGPGVGVFSSTKLPTKYATMNGTSMATPHVAGIAALWAEATGLRGVQLWQKLTSTAKPLPLPSRDVGTGLVQAPTKIRKIVLPGPRIPIPKFPIPRPKLPIPPVPPIPPVL